jgi:hypothetical protein
MLLGETLDIARYGSHGAKLRLLCQDWQVSSIRKKPNQRFDRHFIGNSHPNLTLRLEG